jgi:hypothetical protein
MGKLVNHHVKLLKSEKVKDIFSMQTQRSNGGASLSPSKSNIMNEMSGKGRFRALSLNQFRDVML